MRPSDVLDFCFPVDIDVSLDRHLEFWGWFMRGGADDAICAQFADSVDRAVAGELDDWLESARGRLALVIVLDQFPRSLYRGSPRAYAQDHLALELVREGLENGDFEALATPWERTLFTLPLVHAEGADHCARVALGEELALATLEMAPSALRPAYEFCLGQSRRHRAVIDQFGRHPHRNAILDREPTPDEQVYLDRGEFPHERDVSLR